MNGAWQRHINNSTDDGVVVGIPHIFLRLEGLAVLACATSYYWHSGFSWIVFAALFFAPDIFMVGYLLNSRLGALIYNIGHSYVTPCLIIAASLFSDIEFGIAMGIIWIAHIGFDRAVGYGLKYTDAFQHTHLGPFVRK
ncbi:MULTISPECIES: DUF4260 domain-containing protein [unclassified Rhizobium]|uniref:DUF4260 domain-containing protein n=1 Tax=unclassified Rhizobium TaxID=2613769 RepID=UPI002168703E|nr:MULTISPECIES: DUF4260 domain-containing protein [unclassified Rhizobium]MCS3744285.1 hypothetical protein [Rhizobium sp. BK661]MCS4096240.1 hypothetical protein [Rhizobium sp. BK176]